jgi:hypothetical protein
VSEEDLTFEFRVESDKHKFHLHNVQITKGTPDFFRKGTAGENSACEGTECT